MNKAMRNTFTLCIFILLFFSSPIKALVINSVVIEYSIAVMVFDEDAINTTRLSLLLDNISISIKCAPYTIRYRFDIEIHRVPSWALQDLREWFKDHYEDRGKPYWVREYEERSGFNLTIKWVNLVEFYNYLYSLVKNIDRYFGIDPDDHVVIIGDIDNVSRQYYIENRNPEDNKTIVLEGIRGWGGIAPLVFYDLTVIAKPRPESWQPFYGIGRPTSYTYEPPIWDLIDDDIYVANLIRDHILSHIVGNYVSTAWFPRYVDIDINIIDFGNRSRVNEILSRIDPRYVVSLAKSIAPWIHYRVDIEIINARDIPGLIYAIEYNSNRSWMIIDYGILDIVLHRYALSRISCITKGFVHNFTFLFFILATPKPSYMQWRGGNYRFNFTGYSAGCYGALSYPGYGYRVLRGGIVRAIVHELGHTLGLDHPFQVGIKIRWLMDWVSSVMSYEDSVIAVLSYIPRDFYSQYRLAVVHSLVLFNYLIDSKGVSIYQIERYLNMLSKGDAINALQQLLLVVDRIDNLDMLSRREILDLLPRVIPK